ncbi:glycerate kinase [Yaniella halotolerans]|uniref:glycerate kinase n=1 Tax=Yaniella halotolerans TaxID=225453 RepID=UPI0003B735D0|nr:glycerate kinase [Yaniella halotolerans]
MSTQAVIVIAADKFKGSATAEEVAVALKRGLRSTISPAEVRCVPVADGGEGTVDAAISAGFKRQITRVTGPIGEPIDAAWAMHTSSDGIDAVVELAQASGIELLETSRLTGATATSRGTGELLQAALDAGATRITLGLGGSACTDGGAGMLAALGVELLDQNGKHLADGGAALQHLDQVNLTGLDPRWMHTKLVLASDVENPLLGHEGAAAVFGPQKGLTGHDVVMLDAALGHYAQLLTEATERDFGLDAGQSVADHVAQPGAGAAGGAGFGAMAVLRAQRRSGIDVILDLVGFADALADADLVITGEGSLDAQTLQGKAPAGVAQLASQQRIPVYAVCGRNLLSTAETEAAGITRVFALTELEPDPDVSMRQTPSLLTQVGEQIGDILLAQPA